MISYNPLWKTLIDKGIKRSELIARCNIGAATLAKMGKNKSVTIETINKICNELHVPVSEVIEYVEEE